MHMKTRWEHLQRTYQEVAVWSIHVRSLNTGNYLYVPHEHLKVAFAFW